MKPPVVASTDPIRVELQPGTYWWCSCGRSRNQPYCDGSHSGTGFEPTPIELTRAKKLWLCTCKHSKAPPYCDGSHSEHEQAP